jgi:1-acyl-sn-glycerol-3-phosphate acyltransferase
MSALAWGLLGVTVLAAWLRWGPPCFETLEILVMGWFARAWHRCVRCGPCTLPADGPAILVANHPSHADPAFLMACCPRPLCFLQARECYDLFLLRRLFRRVGCIPVSRGRPDFSAVRLALERLRHGAVVCLFPEGEVGEAGVDRVGEGKSGAALLALRSRAPVIPAHISGGPRTRSMVGAWLWPSPGVRVTFGPPIDLSTYYGCRIDHKRLREVTVLIARRIAGLRPEPDDVRHAADLLSLPPLEPCDAGTPSGSSS